VRARTDGPSSLRPFSRVFRLQSKAVGRQPSADGAFVIEVVQGIEAERPVCVDVRLPAKALNLGQNADGQPVPFTWLTAVVDSHQELEQVSRENDFATLNRAEIVRVAPL
jgi:hypothetical protein